MSDTTGLAKMLMALGVVFLLVGLLIPGEDAPWEQMVTNLSAQTFPTFVNPFSSIRTNFSMIPVADGNNGPASATDNNAFAGCTNATSPSTDYWECVATEDAEVSYVGITVADDQFEVNLSSEGGVPTNLPVLWVTVSVQCNTTGAEAPFQIALEEADGSLIAQFDMPACEGDWITVVRQNEFVPARPTTGQFNGGRAQPVFSSGFANISFISVNVFYNTEPECSPADTLTYIGCLIGQTLVVLFKVALIAINAVIFGVQLIFYGLTVGAILFGGFLSVIQFLFAVPGAPIVVQALIDIVLAGMIFTLLLTVVRLIRGGGGL